MYAEGEGDSIHLTRWPEVAGELIDEEAERRGDLIIAVIGAVRREKSRRGIPLSRELEAIDLYADESFEIETLRMGIRDIAGTLKARRVEVHKGRGGEQEVEDYPKIGFTIEL
jgi:valyl-tRNA synthetase